MFFRLGLIGVVVPLVTSLGFSAEMTESTVDPQGVEGSDPEESRSRNFESLVQTRVEGLFTDDFQISQWGFQYGHRYDRFRWDVGLTYDTYEIDLRSPDPFFEPQSSHADRILVQGNVTQQIQERLSWQGIAGYYDGFQNFRSLWIHDYYQQIGSLPFFDGYPEIAPRGYQLGTQLRWEYLPASGFLEATFGYYKDWIAPSAEFERVTLLGLRVIDSLTYRLASENVLNPRIRSLTEFLMTDTAGREKRYGIQQSVNVALGESWVLRFQGAWVREDPGFEAYSVGGTAEHELGDAWLVSLFARFYHDTGEIQNSLPSSNGPPGLDSYQIGLGVRWMGERSNVKLTAGPYFTRYKETEIEAPFFEDLYRSRNWLNVQIAYSLSF